MRIWKKALSVGLSLVLCASLVSPALAASFQELQAAIDGSAGDYGEGAIVRDENNTITLKDNVTSDGNENITISGDADITLDLNGYNVEGSYGDFWTKGMLEVENGAKLTVENTLDGEDSGTDGKIVNRSDSGNTMLVKGEAKVSSGTIAAEQGTLKSVLVQGGSFSMEGGRIDGGTEAGLGVMDAGGKAVIKGGEIFGKTGATAQQKGTLQVEAGIIAGTAGAGISSTQSGHLILTGGKVSAKEGSGDADISIVHGANIVEISSGLEFTTLGISANSDGENQSNTITVAGQYEITYGGDRTVSIKPLNGSEDAPVLYDIDKKMIVKNGDKKEDGGYWEWIILGPEAVNDPANQIPDTTVKYQFVSGTEGVDLPDDFPEASADADTSEIPVSGGKWVFQAWSDTVREGDLYDVDQNPVAGVPTVPVFDANGVHFDTVTVEGTWTFEADEASGEAPEPPDDSGDGNTTPDTPSVPGEGGDTIVIAPPSVPLGGEPDDVTVIDEVEVPLAGLFTRADAIGYLWEKSGSPEWELSDFEDVPEDHTWAVAIGWAQDMGIAVADEDGNFRPDDLVLRSVEDLETDPEGEFQQFLDRYAVFAGAADEGETFMKLDGDVDDVIMGEEAQVIFDEFFKLLDEALTQAA